MATPLTNNLKNNSPKPLDFWQKKADGTAFASKQEAHDALVYKFGGRNCFILISGVLVEHWYATEKASDAYTIDDLVVKTPDLSNKVDKVTGKDLSTNDFTTTEKQKLAALSNFDPTSINQTVSNKVDKVNGKQLSANDYISEDKSIVTFAGAHMVNVENPHNVNKAQVGLSNVPNVNAVQRENHQGTQPVESITGLDAAVSAIAAPLITTGRIAASPTTVPASTTVSYKPDTLDVAYTNFNNLTPTKANAEFIYNGTEWTLQESDIDLTGYATVDSTVALDSNGNFTGGVIGETQWEHPRGATELAGDSSYSQIGLMSYEKITSNAIFNKVVIPFWADNNSGVTVRIYKSTILDRNPSNLLLLEEVLYPVSTFNTVVETTITVPLLNTYSARTNDYIYVFVIATSGNAVECSKWNEDSGTAPTRHALSYFTTTVNPWTTAWDAGSLPSYAQSTFKLIYIASLDGSTVIPDTIDFPSLTEELRNTVLNANKVAADSEYDIQLLTNPPKNLFDYNATDIERGKYIAGDGPNVGNLTDNTGYSVTGYIPIVAYQTLSCNKTEVSIPVGSNLYDVNKVLLSTVSNSNAVTASQDGFVRFSLSTSAAEDISNAAIQVENGTVSTGVVPFGKTLSGEKITFKSIERNKLAPSVTNILDAFVTKNIYDSTLVQVAGSNKTVYSAVDISGWGQTLTKTGKSFNAIRLPAGITYDPTVPDNRKWKYVQVWVKNAQTDASAIAKSDLIDIGGLTTLPEMVAPLMTPTLTDFITLSDNSFSGTTYFVNIYFYNADMGFAIGGNINGTMSNYVAGSSKYTIDNSITSWGNYSGNPALIFEHLLLTNVRKFQHLAELDNIVPGDENGDPQPVQETIEISLPDKIYAIVGDTLQLFYRGIIKAVNPYNYDINITCSKGAWLPRYFEYTPVIGDVGTATLTIKVKNSNGVVVGTKACSLITKNSVGSPSTAKKVLTIGDSLTDFRVYQPEAFRRLTGTGGSPAGKGFTNISFEGRKRVNKIGGSGTTGTEGNSGWSWVDYLTVGRKAYTFTVTAPTVMPSIESVYSDANGKLYTMWWDYSTTSLKFKVNDLSSTPPSSGTLTKVSDPFTSYLFGADLPGDATITYSSVVQSSSNPFWNDSTHALDITSYVNKWCSGSIDVFYFLMTWNRQTGNRTDFGEFTDYAAAMFSHIHSAYPSAKIKLMGVQVPDVRGGVRVDGSPVENTYTDTYGLVVTALNMNKAYQDLANDPSFSSYVEFVNVSSQVDSEYNMPYTTKPVNTRNSKGATELIGVNDVHPGTLYENAVSDGFLNISDVMYRNFVANFCQ